MAHPTPPALPAAPRAAPARPALWTPQQVAAETGASTSALAKGRMGIGPLASLPFVRLGLRRVAYRPEDVARWIESRLARSTAEARTLRESGR
jgi:hypothetical protein